jgi:N5-(cytidine 5'-diphosphoramidyl)-L-glutamine hydrolase
MFRFGVTTRITQAEAYNEPRDSLAHDWGVFFQREFPNDLWVSIPNIGKDSIKYFESLSLNVLILSGGDSLGETPKRDETEYALLEYALENGIPVIAICRGMQLVHSYFGGKILEGGKEFTSIHRANMHEITLNGGEVFITNSFHNNFLLEEGIDQNVMITARCVADNSIEAFMGRGFIGMMWHPERAMKDTEWSTIQLKHFLKDYDKSNHFSRG